MTDLAAWNLANDAYLAAAVEWLRLVLGYHATAVPTPFVAVGAQAPSPLPVTPIEPAPEPAEPPAWWKFRRTTTASTPTPPPPPPPPAVKPTLALPPAVFEVSKAQVDEAAEKMRAAAATDPPPALLLLARRLGLSAFEQDLLLLCVAMELDTRIAGLCARVLDDPALPFPTFGLAFTIFHGDEAHDEVQAHWDARSPERPLRFWRMIEVNQPWSHPLTSSALRADERIVNYVKGLSHLDDRLAPFVMPLGDDVHDDDLPPSQGRVVDDVVQAIQTDSPRVRPIQLLGRDTDSKQLVARAAAHRLGLSVYRMPADLLPSQAADLETLSRLWYRETLLLPVALYLDARDVERSSEAHATALKRFLARSGGVVFVDAKETWPVPHGSHSFDVDKPTAAEQRAIWQSVLGDEHAGEAARLAGQFHLSAESIANIAGAAKAEDGDAPLSERLWSRVSHHTRMHIDALAQRIDAKATWDDLVLPPTEVVLLHQIAAHVAGRGQVYDDWGFRERMSRGFGTSVLFAGESGTGKTMAAEVIANELSVPLHRIDLSSVVSKWVGETEKNLQQLFNAADDSNGILFFDEADALFGKRTEVQHSQDRFANMEINFLLQRLESYRGLAILATNMKSALDQAFLRRLRFIVNFPFPGPAERREIWKKAFPKQAPVGDLDYDWLAKLQIAGGSIHNVALAASFLASHRGGAITMPLVLEAARTEMRKLDKPVSEADFKWTESAPPNVVEMKRS